MMIVHELAESVILHFRVLFSHRYFDQILLIPSEFKFGAFNRIASNHLCSLDQTAYRTL